MTFHGEVQTCVICGYNPCGNEEPNFWHNLLPAAPVLDYEEKLTSLLKSEVPCGFAG